MENHLSHFMLIVKDMNRSVEFYRDKLGFKVEDQTPKWSELMTDSGIELALKQKDEGDVVGSGGFGFVVTDCRKATDVLKEKGVEIVKDCESRENGTKYLTQVRDPDGDIIWFVQNIH